MLVGDFHFSPVTSTLNTESTTDMLEVSTLNDSVKVYIPGQDTSRTALTGWLDVDAAANLHFDQMNDLKSNSTPEPFTHAPNGLALGQEVFMAGVLQGRFTTGARTAGRVTYAMDLKGTGATDPGVSLHDLVAVTTDTDGTGYDGSASSSSGGAGHLHVTAFSGFSTADIVIADSADNSSFATILTFTQVTGLTQQRSVITGTVRRYLRYSIDVTGSGSITFAVTFARR